MKSGGGLLVVALTAVVIIGAVIWLPGCAPSSDGRWQEEVAAVIDSQTAAWNRGDIPGYMKGYWYSDSLLFTSGGRVRRGWQETLEKYRPEMQKLYYDPSRYASYLDQLGIKYPTVRGTGQ